MFYIFKGFFLLTHSKNKRTHCQSSPMCSMEYIFCTNSYVCQVYILSDGVSKVMSAKTHVNRGGNIRESLIPKEIFEQSIYGIRVVSQSQIYL